MRCRVHVAICFVGVVRRMWRVAESRGRESLNGDGNRDLPSAGATTPRLQCTRMAAAVLSTAHSELCGDMNRQTDAWLFVTQQQHVAC